MNPVASRHWFYCYSELRKCVIAFQPDISVHNIWRVPTIKTSTEDIPNSSFCSLVFWLISLEQQQVRWNISEWIWGWKNRVVKEPAGEWVVQEWQKRWKEQRQQVRSNKSACGFAWLNAFIENPWLCILSESTSGQAGCMTRSVCVCACVCMCVSTCLYQDQLLQINNSVSSLSRGTSGETGR